MAVQNIHIEKLNLINWISKIQDISLLEQLIEFKKYLNSEKDWYSELTVNQKKAIEKSLQSLDNNSISNDIVQKDIDKYIKKKILKK